MKKINNIQGNLLGGDRAEVDHVMLEKAFVQTHDFQALVTTTNFNFVVGRRGTGKSALFIKALTTFPRAPCITGEISVGSGVLFEPILRCSFFGKYVSHCYHGIYLARVLS